MPLFILSFQVAYPPLLQYLFAPTFFNCWLAKKALNSLLVSMGNALKFLNTRSLPKRSRQTAQTQIRLLLKKQSDQGLCCLLF